MFATIFAIFLYSLIAVFVRGIICLIRHKNEKDFKEYQEMKDEFKEYKEFKDEIFK